MLIRFGPNILNHNGSTIFCSLYVFFALICTFLTNETDLASYLYDYVQIFNVKCDIFDGVAMLNHVITNFSVAWLVCRYENK